jgi:general secretion pathway protein E
MTKEENFGLETASELFEYPFVKNKVQILPYEFAKRRQVLPLKEEEGVLWVAIADPLALEALEEVRLRTGKEVVDLLASQERLDAAIEQCYHQSEEATSELFNQLRGQESGAVVEQEGYDLLAQKSSDSPVIRILNAILLEAIQQGASDIHFEPMEATFSVRYRIDGVLQLRHTPPKEYQPQLLTRIKVMARLDIAEQRLPQDGRMKLRFGGRQIDFRVSTLPVVYGERIVLRILDKSNITLGLGNIGMPSKALSRFTEMIHMSEGIVLVTGPTGSGKTTTLYSALSEIQSTHMNIMTIEDPVEYKLQGMAQIGVNPKIDLTFSKGLRHILRQDPDVIMIGEIRDQETAEIAIQSALTGHLVLSTLHTNDAPSALTRLVDMGIEPYLLSSSIIGILAQRLVRTICPKCKASYIPAPSELHDLYLDPATPHLFKGQGCDQCYDTGYKGRRGIYELMPLGSVLKRKLVETADSATLQEVALKEGMQTLRQSGGQLVKEGVTTSAEVFRVTRGCEDGI